MNAMHVWEVGLARFEINDLNMFSGREIITKGKKSADKSTRGATMTVRMGSQKFSFQKKKRTEKNALKKNNNQCAQYLKNLACTSKQTQQPCENV